MHAFSNRISYIVYALEKIKSQCSGEQQVLLLYDVACTLKRHLQVCMQPTLCMYTDILNYVTIHIKGYQAKRPTELLYMCSACISFLRTCCTLPGTHFVNLVIVNFSYL